MKNNNDNKLEGYEPTLSSRFLAGTHKHRKFQENLRTRKRNPASFYNTTNTTESSEHLGISLV